MATWQNEDTEGQIEIALESVGLDRTPKKVYKDEIKPVLEDYKGMLEENNFKVELDEPDDSGIVEGKVKASLTVDSFKLPATGIGSGRVGNELIFTISAEEGKVTADSEFGDGESGEPMNPKPYEGFSQLNAEAAIYNFNTKLIQKIE